MEGEECGADWRAAGRGDESAAEADVADGLDPVGGGGVGGVCGWCAELVEARGVGGDVGVPVLPEGVEGGRVDGRGDVGERRQGGEGEVVGLGHGGSVSGREG